MFRELDVKEKSKKPDRRRSQKWSHLRKRVTTESSQRVTTVPGLDPTTKEDGNLGDIGKAGSLHEFLLELHCKFGAIAGFWWGKIYVVSIASPQLFQEHHNVSDKPNALFSMFIPMFGLSSLQYIDGVEGRARRRHYDRAFAHQVLPRYCSQFQRLADNILQKWLQFGPQDHVPLTKYTNSFALKSAFVTLLGEKLEDDLVSQYKVAYDKAWAEMEHRLSGPFIPDEDSVRGKQFKEAMNSMHSIIRKVVASRKERNLNKQGNKLIDIMIEICPDDESISCDAVTYTTGGFHTAMNVLSWGFYFIAHHKDVQDKLYNEIKEILGDEETIDESNFSDFVYLIQVIDETMRCAVVAPWAARVQDFDSQLGGHKIPQNTPVVHALGVVLQNEKLWPSPKKFDPDRFSKDNLSNKSPYAFSPFGFAGKRKCPGYKFAYLEEVVLIATLIRRFEISVWNDQVAKPVFGFVTHPEEEIWLKIVKRK